MANLTLDLTKKKEIVTGLLLDKGVRNAPTMRVDLSTDISWSMNSLINKGKLQKAVNQITGVAVTFDDDGDVDVRKFDDRCEYVGTLTVDNYTDYVAKHGIAARGGTQYAPIVKSVIDHHFGAGQKIVEVEPAKKGFFGVGAKPAVTKIVSDTGKPVDTTPVLAIIITDGDCQDKDAIDRALDKAQAYNIYWHFVAVGDGPFPTIAKLAKKYPNVGEVYLHDFDMSDEAVYKQIICDELVEWVHKFETPGRQTA